MKILFITIFLFCYCDLQAQDWDWESKSFFSDRKIIRENDSIVEEVNIFNISIEDSLVIHNRIDHYGNRESQLYKMVDVKIDEEGRLVIYFRSDKSYYFIEIVSVETDSKSGTILNMMHRNLYRVEEYHLKTFHDE